MTPVKRDLSHQCAVVVETETHCSSRDSLGCRKWGCNKWGLKGCLAALAGNRPKSAFFGRFLPFSPFSGGCEEHLENPENGGKRPFSSDILGFKPPSLKPPFAALLKRDSQDGFVGHRHACSSASYLRTSHT